MNIDPDSREDLIAAPAIKRVRAKLQPLLPHQTKVLQPPHDHGRRLKDSEEECVDICNEAVRVCKEQIDIREWEYDRPFALTDFPYELRQHFRKLKEEYQRLECSHFEFKIDDDEIDTLMSQPLIDSSDENP